MEDRTIIYHSRSSAPGKVILFGEHAVVHGVTAVAAALSDLRIFVDIFVTSNAINDELHVVFEDIIDESTGEITRITLEFDKICLLSETVGIGKNLVN